MSNKGNKGVPQNKLADNVRASAAVPAPWLPQGRPAPLVRSRYIPAPGMAQGGPQAFIAPRPGLDLDGSLRFAREPQRAGLYPYPTQDHALNGLLGLMNRRMGRWAQSKPSSGPNSGKGVIGMAGRASQVYPSTGGIQKADVDRVRESFDIFNFFGLSARQ